MDFYFPTTSTNPKTHDFGCCLSILGLGFVRHLPFSDCHSSRPWVTWADLASYIQTWLLWSFFSCILFYFRARVFPQSLDMFFLMCSPFHLKQYENQTTEPWGGTMSNAWRSTISTCLQIHAFHWISWNHVIQTVHPGKIDMVPKNEVWKIIFLFN